MRLSPQPQLPLLLNCADEVFATPPSSSTPGTATADLQIMQFGGALVLGQSGGLSDPPLPGSAAEAMWSVPRENQQVSASLHTCHQRRA